ncbi:hypothetical protein CCP3SC15_1770001 [Gammaproteobacteria bacterium]
MPRSGVMNLAVGFNPRLNHIHLTYAPRLFNSIGGI